MLNNPITCICLLVDLTFFVANVRSINRMGDSDHKDSGGSGGSCGVELEGRDGVSVMRHFFKQQKPFPALFLFISGYYWWMVL